MADYYSSYKPKIKPPKKWEVDPEEAKKPKPEESKPEPDKPARQSEVKFGYSDYPPEPGIEEMGDPVPKLKKLALQKLRDKGYENAADLIDILSPDDTKDIALGAMGVGLAAKLKKLGKAGKALSKESKLLDKGEELFKREFPDELDSVERSAEKLLEKTGRVPPKVPEPPKSKEQLLREIKEGEEYWDKMMKQ
jgi:hypothetical protein